MKDEYVRKQDALDAIGEEYVPRTDFERGMVSQLSWNKAKIKALPLADVVPVVRCRDCEHYYFADNRIPQEQRYVCEISGEIWKPDDFCSFGKRREE